MIFMIGVDLPDGLVVHAECSVDDVPAEFFACMKCVDNPVELVIYSKPTADSTAWKREHKLEQTVRDEIGNDASGL